MFCASLAVLYEKVGLEMCLGAKSYLSHLCFADDVALIATSAKQLQMMIHDLKEATAKRGLKIHSGKTKVLTNAWAVTGTRVPSNIVVDGEQYSVLGHDESTKYLGRKVCYNDPNEVEFSNRVAVAWGAFSKHKEELTDRRYWLKDRLKLFDAVVTSTLLYGCETWTLKADQQRRLQVLQRKMLRMVMNAKRRTLQSSSDNGSVHTETSDDDSAASQLEPWPDFLKRTAHWVDQQLEREGLCQWVVQWRRRKWKWAGELMEGKIDKWSSRATLWQPLLHSSSAQGRKQARPKKRWEQEFADYVEKIFPETGKRWQDLAKDSKWWLAEADKFANA